MQQEKSEEDYPGDAPGLAAEDSTAGEDRAAGPRFVFDLARSIRVAESGTEADTAALEPLTVPSAATMATLRQEFDEFLMMYRFGISEVLTKITILREEYETRNGHSLIEHVNSRVKSMDSLLAKVQRLECPPHLPTIGERVRDIAGIRITCAFADDVYRVAESLTAQNDITVLDTKDYIRSPKANGYQSLHLILAVPVFLSDGVHSVPVEVQIRTIAMDFWASLEHKIYYKYDRDVPQHLIDELKSAADSAHALDVKMARLRDEVHRLGE